MPGGKGKMRKMREQETEDKDKETGAVGNEKIIT